MCWGLEPRQEVWPVTVHVYMCTHIHTYGLVMYKVWMIKKLKSDILFQEGFLLFWNLQPLKITHCTVSSQFFYHNFFLFSLWEWDQHCSDRHQASRNKVCTYVHIYIGMHVYYYLVYWVIHVHVYTYVYMYKWIYAVVLII